MLDLPQTYNRSLSKPKTLNYWSPSLPQRNRKIQLWKFDILWKFQYFVKINEKKQKKKLTIMPCSRMCILRNRISQNRAICEWLHMTINMLITMELAFVIQDQPRIYSDNSVVISYEDVRVYKRLLCLKLSQYSVLMRIVESGCADCNDIQFPPWDPTVWRKKKEKKNKRFSELYYISKTTSNII